MAPKESIGREVVVCVGGIVLMFVGHALGFIAWRATEELAFRLPYWWSYVLIYPAAAALALHVMRAHWLSTAACLCAAPVLYFLHLGVVDGNWLASDAAFGGSLAAFFMTAVVGYVVTRRHSITAAREAIR